MRFRSALVPVVMASWVLSLAAFASPAHGAKHAGRLGRSVVPGFQSVELKIDPSEATYSGSTEIQLDVLEPTGSFLIHAEGMTFDSLSMTSSFTLM